MDDESGESMEPMEEVSLKELGDAELERLVRGLHNVTVVSSQCVHRSQLFSVSTDATEVARNRSNEAKGRIAACISNSDSTCFKTLLLQKIATL